MDHGRKRGFAQSSKRQAGERNSKLHSGDHAMEVPQENLNDAGAHVTLAHELAHAGEAHGDKRELGRRKKSIQRDKCQDAD
jgi:hypothetical protein